MTPQSPSTLRTSFAALRQQGLRARDAARRLDTSEGEVLAAHAVNLLTPSEAVSNALVAVPLDGEWIPLLRGLEAVGPVMALTRNEHVVHEKIGTYQRISAQGPIGLAVGPDIDLRLFLHHWHAGFHVTERDAQGEHHSLQFFDRYGQAVHKVHARDQTSLPLLTRLVQHHACTDAKVRFDADRPLPTGDRPDLVIDRMGLQQAWAGMRDTHAFFDLLKQFDVGRLQALRLMAGAHTLPTPLHAVYELLDSAAAMGLPIMVFTGNAGCLQIHTGPVEHIEPMGPWLNVLDSGFNLHLRQDAIAHSWLVSKPTDDGPVTSIELYDERGDLMVMFFGARKPGQPELRAWRELAHALASPGVLPEQREAA